MPKTIETVIRVDENKYKKIKKLVDKKRNSVSKLLESKLSDFFNNTVGHVSQTCRTGSCLEM